MPYTIERWQDSEVIVVRATEGVSSADSETLLSAIGEACATRPSSRVIIDLSAVDYLPSTTEAQSFARRFADLAKPLSCLIAVVARPGASYGMARMIGTLASMEDVSAGAFTSIDEAIAWMNAETGAS